MLILQTVTINYLLRSKHISFFTVTSYCFTLIFAIFTKGYLKFKCRFSAGRFCDCINEVG